MKVKEVFKQLFKYSNRKSNPFWDIECDCENIESLIKIEIEFYLELDNLFKTYRQSEKVMPIVHSHFDEIISWKNKSELQKHKEVFSYLQFVWGLNVTSQLNIVGEFTYCYDVFVKSIFDKTFENGEEYDLSDIKPFKLIYFTNVYIKANSLSIIEQWFSNLYYYAKSFSGLNDWCEIFFEEVYYYLNESPSIKEYYPQYLSNLFSWCEVNFDRKASNAILKIISKQFNLINWSNNLEMNNVKSLLGLQLLIAKDYEKNNKENLYEELKNNISFHPLLKMQAIMGLCHDETSLIKHLDQLIESFKDYNDSIENQNLNVIEEIYEKARVFKNLLNGPITIASKGGNGIIVERLIASFYDIKIPEVPGHELIIIPNQLKKIIYFFNSELISEEKDTQKIVKELINIENNAFNLFRVIKGGIKQEFNFSDKPMGFPNPSFADNFENKLLELYNFKKIEDFFDQIKTMIQFDLNSFPLQALMIKSIGKTLPINLSLSKKGNFPKVKKILFWSGFSQTSEIEKTALSEVFSLKGINFEVHDEESSSLNLFIKKINECDPEIVWISSHGEYHHYEPNRSEIKFSERESISIREYNSLINTSNKRRLLILNVCEGGVHAQTGEFKNLGFPNLLAGYNQDVISHLWMAEPRFAYVFGVFIAIGIAFFDKNYFEAFEYSLTKVLSNKQNILDEIELIDAELSDFKDRVQNNDTTKWGNLITTGSPVYNI